MSLIDFHTDHGNVIGCDVDGMFIPGHVGRHLDEELHPEDYDKEGHRITPREVMYIAGSMAVELTQTD
jgi:hypothetical protein